MTPYETYLVAIMDAAGFDGKTIENALGFKPERVFRRKALGMTTEDVRIAELMHKDGMSCRQIGAIFGVCGATVKKNLMRAGQ